jgi:glycolate oxidase FAD binding subunit
VNANSSPASGALRPASPAELCDIVAGVASDGAKLRVRGGGSKDAIGAPVPAARVLDLSGFSGVNGYDPPELVITAGAGTPLAVVETMVAAEGQMLAFDPIDHGRLFGTAAGAATIGGIVAAGVSGPRRLSGGAVRDHLLGFEGVSGEGRLFKAGSRVVKNVTGFDLSKLVTGSWGRLVALTSVTLKVVPQPAASTTMLIRGLDPATAIASMSRAAGSPAGVAAAAHLPDWQGAPATAIRLEGFAESLPARMRTLAAAIGNAGWPVPLADPDALALWDGVRHATSLPADRPLWRINVEPGKAAAMLASLGDAAWLLDWAGALAWIASGADAAAIRRAAAAAGGHAMLVRGDASLRAAVPALHPPSPGIARLEASVRHAFDPAGVFDTGRF